MKFVSNGKTIEFPPRGPAGPDGSPIGTIISYMGRNCPKDYLVCDGSVYALSDYPDLARFFTKQFGSSNYFGGDGVNTFAVPDMRNLFLRGYHGEAEEQLSGEVGIKQDGTKHPNLYASGSESLLYSLGAFSVENPDMNLDYGRTYYYQSLQSGHDSAAEYVGRYCSRPVNMAILYCIKAAESFQAQDVYSTEERRVGTWIDGRPLYQKTFVVDVPTSNQSSTIPNSAIESADNVIDVFGTMSFDTLTVALPFDNRTLYFRMSYDANDGIRLANNITSHTKHVSITLNYTKTTDQAAIQGGISL